MNPRPHYVLLLQLLRFAAQETSAGLAALKPRFPLTNTFHLFAVFSVY